MGLRLQVEMLVCLSGIKKGKLSFPFFNAMRKRYFGSFAMRSFRISASSKRFTLPIGVFGISGRYSMRSGHRRFCNVLRGQVIGDFLQAGLVLVACHSERADALSQALIGHADSGGL